MNSRNLNKIIIVLVVIISILLIILLFGNKSPTVSLEILGEEEITILENSQYIDFGYEIIGGTNDDYYVEVLNDVNPNVPGVYLVKYSLYNKNNELIATKERKVIIKQKDYTATSLSLNGESEEYYFINNYIDKGATAYLNNTDISNAIIVDSNVNQSIAGDYEVKYSVNTINGEYAETKRIVHIINLNIKKNIIESNRKIDLSIDCPSYSYTILPNGNKDYSTKFMYGYNKIGDYTFDIYLKSGSHMKYTVKIDRIEKDESEKPKGTCSLDYNIGKTRITINATAKAGISKYSFNGLYYYDKSFIINSIVKDVVIRVYDKDNDYTDIKCKNDLSAGFKNINNSKLGWYVCGNNINSDNQVLDAIVASYGYKTRGAVVNAALYLANYKYKIPYFWAGKYDKQGFNPKWGCPQDVVERAFCSIPYGGNTCAWGLDCTGFTKWVFIQAGFDGSLIPRSMQEGSMWGSFAASRNCYPFTSANHNLADAIKPGDLVAVPKEHVGLVISTSAATIQVAHQTENGVKVSTLSKTNGRSTNDSGDFTHFVLLDGFYRTYGG